jgi:SAM-dependent methyltransferase
MPRLSAAAQVQRRLWGTDPRAWAELAEAHNRPLFEAVLDAAKAGPGTRLLDVGCGSGLTLVLAQERGAITRPGGRVVASLFAAPERSQGTVVHEVMNALIPPRQAADHAPYSLSAPGHLEAALAEAGLDIAGHGEVVCH